jgi:hypothetical protein
MAMNLPASQRTKTVSLVISLVMAHAGLEGENLAEGARHLLELRVLKLGTMLAEAIQI